MPGDEWWTNAVDRFGLDTLAEPTAGSTSVDDTGDDTDRSARPRRRWRRLGFDSLVIAVFAVGSAFLLRVFVIQQFNVEGQSMLGTLQSGDRVMVNKLSYDMHDPRRGDIVVLKDIKASVEVRDLIKRVVALPGETVEYRDCKLLIDSEPVIEPYLDPLLVGAGHCGESQHLVEIEPGHVFVMGDNRNESLDSRTLTIGQIPYDNLIGRAFVVVWPTSDWRWL